MIRWRISTLTGRYLATTIALLIVSNILTLVLYGLLVLRPQTQRVAGILAQSVEAMAETAQIANPADRARMMNILAESEFVDVWPANAEPPVGERGARILEMMFMRSLVHALSDQKELEWRADPNGRLWVKLKIGPDYYWLSSVVPRSMEPLLALLLVLATTLCLGLLAAFELHRRIGQPLNDMAKAVALVRPDGPLNRIPEAGLDELAALARSFNAMTDRLQAFEAERGLMLAGVSHDVRTPLAKLRLAVELLGGDPDLNRMAHHQVVAIDRILGNFLSFARGFEAEAPQQVELRALAEETAAYYNAEGRHFDLFAHGPQIVLARPEALRRALFNLTENAVKYGQPPFEIHIGAGGGYVFLAVRDFGPGAPGLNFDCLRKPFVRGNAARSGPAGAGLGLAIVERAAKAHGGRLMLSNRPPCGFEARIVFPREGFSPNPPLERQSAREFA